MIKSRYIELPGTSFSPSDLPSDIRDLYDLACEWCLSDPDEVEELAASKERSDLQDFLDRFFRSQELIGDFISQGIVRVPVPDGVAAMDLAFQAYDMLFTFSNEFRPFGIEGKN